MTALGQCLRVCVMCVCVIATLLGNRILGTRSTVLRIHKYVAYMSSKKFSATAANIRIRSWSERVINAVFTGMD